MSAHRDASRTPQRAAHTQCPRLLLLTRSSRCDRYAVIHHERQSEPPPALTQLQALGRRPDAAPAAGLNDWPVVLVQDWETHRDNPLLIKHHRLARSLLSDGFAKELKPDAAERRRLRDIVGRPPTTRLTDDERELFWKFRYSVMSEKRALTKLLKCVDWDEPLEVSAARQIVGRWAPVDVSDLIELLSTQFVATAPWVREFAVAGLAERASDGELLSYLLPLVQAVQYEKALPLPPAAAPLAAFLISRAARNAEIANFFAWYLAVERADERHGDHYEEVHAALWAELDRTRAGKAVKETLVRQQQLVARISAAAASLKASKEARPQKMAKLRAMFDSGGELDSVRSFHAPLPLPLDPNVRVLGSLSHKVSATARNNTLHRHLHLHFHLHLSPHTALAQGADLQVGDAAAGHRVRHRAARGHGGVGGGGGERVAARVARRVRSHLQERRRPAPRPARAADSDARR